MSPLGVALARHGVNGRSVLPFSPVPEFVSGIRPCRNLTSTFGSISPRSSRTPQPVPDLQLPSGFALTILFLFSGSPFFHHILAESRFFVLTKSSLVALLWAPPYMVYSAVTSLRDVQPTTYTRFR